MLTVKNNPQSTEGVQVEVENLCEPMSYVD